MFEQFRSSFPQGSLISELVQIDHGKYIVRAMVQNEGLTLATGLAAAETIEQAEDKARSRALAVLNLPLTPPKHRSISSSEAKPPQGEITPPSPPQDETDEPNTIPSENYNHVSSSPSSLESILKSEPLPTASTPQKEEEVEPTAPSTDETIMDSSDIIARTNVELRRLRWTSEQGRKFLQETYGKRSRSLLSESELLEFLNYLEKQPTPPQDSE